MRALANKICRGLAFCSEVDLPVLALDCAYVKSGGRIYYRVRSGARLYPPEMVLAVALVKILGGQPSDVIRVIRAAQKTGAAEDPLAERIQRFKTDKNRHNALKKLLLAR